MPSFSHEGLVRLFSDRPELAIELLRDVLGIAIPAYAVARVPSGDLTDIKPAPRYADLVVCLETDVPVFAAVLEVQLRVDERKRRSWPSYKVTLHGQLGCDELVVITPDEGVARWAREPIRIGHSVIQPVVIGPDLVPPITDAETARARPELAVLSGVAHGQGPVAEAVEIAHAALDACRRYPDDRALLYSDLVMAALGDAARTALEDLMQKGYEYQSEFARRHQAEGEARGEVRGEARALLTVLESRGLSVTDEQRARITATTDLAELERWLRKAVRVSAVDALFE